MMFSFLLTFLFHDTSLNAAGAGCIAGWIIPRREVVNQSVQIFEFEYAVSVDEAVDGNLSKIGVLPKSVVGDVKVACGCANAEQSLVRNLELRNWLRNYRPTQTCLNHC